MIHDPYAFMSPSGGQDRNEAFDIGPFILGMTASSKFVHKQVGLAHRHLYLDWVGKNMGDLNRRASRVMSAKELMITKGRNPLRSYNRNKNRLGELTRKYITAKKGNPYTQAVKKSSIRGLRFIGLGIAMSEAFSMAVEMFTPGVSKTATVRDRDILVNEAMLDSSKALTQRQRALMAIHDSQMTVRNVIGQEASYFHR